MYNSRFFNLSYLAQNQDDVEYTINDNIFLIDILLQKIAIDFISVPFNNPVHGDLYIIQNGSDIFLNCDNKIAIYDQNNGWLLLEAKNGFELFIINQNSKYIFNSNTWEIQLNSSGNQNSNVDLSNYYTKSSIDLLLNNKISKDGNKVLSDNNFTTELQNKILNLSVVSQTGSYNDLIGKPTLFDGNYNSLINKPIIPETQVNSDWNATDGVAKINNKPTKLSQFENDLNLSSSSASNYIGDYKQSVQFANHGNWLLCNGQAVSRATYSTLFSLIGTSFGIGDNSTTFNLPNFCGRVFAAIGQGVGLTNRTLGQSFGSENHTLTVNEMPSHNHAFTIGKWASSASGAVDVPVTNNYLTQINIRSGYGNQPAGGGQSHNNMQPTLFAGNVFIYAK